MKSLFCRSILINRSKYTPSNWKHPRNLDRKHWNYSSMRTELWTSNEPNHVRPFKKLCMFVLLKTYVWHLAFIKYLVNFLSFISLQRRSKGLGRKPYPFTTGEVCDRKKYPDFHKKQSEQERINTSRLHWFAYFDKSSAQRFTNGFHSSFTLSITLLLSNLRCKRMTSFNKHLCTHDRNELLNCRFTQIHKSQQFLQYSRLVLFPFNEQFKYCARSQRIVEFVREIYGHF